MEKKDAQQIRRYRVCITDQAWNALLARSVIENDSPSEIISYLLNNFLKRRTYPLFMFLYPGKDVMLGNHTRTIRIPTETWRSVRTLCRTNNLSASVVVEFLVRRYLGFDYKADPLLRSIDLSHKSPRYLECGGRVYDLGEDPVIIDADMYLKLLFSDYDLQQDADLDIQGRI